jgi:hypothetical protein
MSKLHDELLASARTIDASADALNTSATALIAAKGEGDNALADVRELLASTGHKLADLQARVDAAATDAGNQGDQGGAGNGAGGNGAGGVGQTNLGTGAGAGA